MSARTENAAAIKRASQIARDSMNSFDDKAFAEITNLYSRAIDDLRAIIDQYTGVTGAVDLQNLNALLSQSEARLKQLSESKALLLSQGIDYGIQQGIAPFAVDAAMLTVGISTIAQNASNFIRNFVGADGLQLSDRIWRTDNNAKQIVANAINQAVINGYSASKAAQELLSQGEPVGKPIQDKLKANAAGPLKQKIEDELFVAESSPYANSLRVFRTEINRAHINAYESAAFSHPDVVGTRFLLSPNHPRHDICDMHAQANLYGLGPGVYPKDKNPCPAHPNTLSYTEVVFADEVTGSDRAGKQSRLDWLSQQPASVQESVLNSRKKRIAFEKGLLNENAIATPWNIIKVRLERQGHNPENW